ncbi:MAG TPA: hypothetical protein PLO37_22415 [Candidatus Hydrogenedentes bacterium]|nr:hypothetical protein [Candidatus Hydrogenedentota bacterium]HPG69610.1 hypothetical protein [Candidatus Hydrogenedentota bacterium]
MKHTQCLSRTTNHPCRAESLLVWQEQVKLLAEIVTVLTAAFDLVQDVLAKGDAAA